MLRSGEAGKRNCVIELRLEIPLSPEAVWDLLADISNADRFPAVLSYG